MKRRLLARLAAVLAVLSAVVLSLADRAPALTHSAWGRTREVGHRFETSTGLDIVDRSDIALEWDTIGHIVLWSMVTVAVLAVTGRRRPWLTAAGLFALSGAIEMAQAVFASSRHTEFTDLAANGVGITIGVMAGGVFVAATTSLRRRDQSGGGIT